MGSNERAQWATVLSLLRLSLYRDYTKVETIVASGTQKMGKNSSEKRKRQQAAARTPAAGTAKTASHAPHEDDIRVLQNQAQLLIDRVGRIQDKIDEPRRPWYRNPPLIVSVIALVVSLTFSAVGIVREITRQVTQDRNKTEDDLYLTVRELGDIDREMQSAFRSARDPGEQSAVGSALTGKRQVLLRRADTLVGHLRSLGGSPQPDFLLAIGFAESQEGRWGDAENRLSEARGLCKRAECESLVDNGLASLYMVPGTSIHDPDHARQLWGEQLTVLASKPDPKSASTFTQLAMNWANAEAMNGNQQEAKVAIARARANLRRNGTPPAFSAGQENAVASLEDAMNAWFATGFRFSGPKGGACRMTFRETPSRVGLGVFVAAQPGLSIAPSQPASLNLTVYESGNAMAPASGLLFSSDNKSYFLQWSPSGGPVSPPVIGSAHLEFDSASNKLVGSLYAFGSTKPEEIEIEFLGMSPIPPPR